MAGPVVSWVVSWVVGALEVVVGGLSVLRAALYTIGIPKDSIVQYETALRANKFLLGVHGPMAEVENARDIFNAQGAQQVDIHETEGASVA